MRSLRTIFKKAHREVLYQAVLDIIELELPPPKKGLKCSVRRERGTKTVCYTRIGMFHREDEPALARYDIRDNRLLSAIWAQDGRPFRADGGPTHVEIDRSRCSLEEWFNGFGSLHRSNGPAQIERDNKDRVLTESYYFDGERHRSDGPAMIWYDPDTGAVTGEEWIRYGLNHRDGGLPSSWHLDLRTGTTALVEYGRNGQAHLIKEPV